MKSLKRFILNWLGIPHDIHERMVRLEIRQMGLDPDDPMLAYLLPNAISKDPPRRNAVGVNFNVGSGPGL